MEPTGIELMINVLGLVMVIVCSGIFGALVARSVILWAIHQHGVINLELKVSDAGDDKHEVRGPTNCRKCGEDLLVYARPIGHDIYSGEMRYEKFGRCSRWRFWSPRKHCRRSNFEVAGDRGHFDSYFGRFDYED